MDSLIQTLVALVAALSVATGSPTTTGAAPDRPAIVVPVSSSAGSASPSSSTQSTEIKGTIQSINGNTIVVNGIEITLTSSTEIKGKLQVGATVQVEGAKQTNGVFLAKEVQVGGGSSASSDLSKKDDSSPGADDKSKDSDDKSGGSVGDDKSRDDDDKSSSDSKHDDDKKDDSDDDDDDDD
ncbi:MAG: DUF5666 domain-containing protein [Chloroflexota bacterium]